MDNLHQANQRQADEILLAKLAGHFAGEGCINIAAPNKNCPKRYPALRVQVETSEKCWSDLYHRYFGGFTWLTTPRAERNRKFMFGWRVTGKQAEQFLLAIQPHLIGEKVQQLEVALQFMQEKRKYYRQPVGIGCMSEKFEAYGERLKGIRRAAAETNRKDANAWRSDSPTLEEIPVS